MNAPRNFRPRKLTAADVLTIRASTETGIVLAARHGVGKSHISEIRNGNGWVWLSSEGQSS